MNHPKLTVRLHSAFAFVAAACFASVASNATLADTYFSDSEENFCAQAQALIAPTGVTAKNKLHVEYETFVDSKVSAYPLEVQQFFSNPASENAELYTALSCKMRTAGSIADAYSEAGESVVEVEDTSCNFLITAMLNDAAGKVGAADTVLKPSEIVVDDEKMTFMGPMWLSPWPFVSAYRDEAGLLHLASRALYVPWSIFIPAPPAFKGVYYCHLPTPSYLEALLRGQIEAPLEG